MSTNHPYACRLPEPCGFRAMERSSRTAPCGPRRSMLEDLDTAHVAVDADQVSRPYCRRAGAGTGHSGQTVLATDDRGVTHHPPDVGDGGPDLAEYRGPGRSGDRRHQNLAFPHVTKLVGVRAPASHTLDEAGRGRHTGDHILPG